MAFFALDDLGKCWTIPGYFEHLSTGVLSGSRLGVLVGKETSGAARRSKRSCGRQHVVQVVEGAIPMLDSGPKSIGVQSARSFTLYDLQKHEFSCVDLGV